MLSGPVKERKKHFNKAFIAGWSDYNARNEAADDIIASPDKFLLNQEELFAAQGSWATFGLTLGLAGAGGAAAIMARPGMAAHLGRGQLKALEWGMLGGGAFAGGFVGQNLGVQLVGDAAKYDAHWMAYTFVKTQNRYVGGSVLTDAPTY